MPAVVDDPASPTIYRVSGQAPFPDPGAPLPITIVPRRVTLRDRQTVATILPIVSAQHQVPASLITYLCGQINREIEGGDTYPMMEPFTPAGFAAHWFQNFGAVMLLGDYASADRIPDSHDWARDCLGSFYIKPNYPGRSSHVCNGGLLVTDASRNRGVGRLMGESYIDWAPRLGYTYSVFNLVYETNVASCRIWDALGFKRIGRVKGCGNLRSHPDRLIDAIIYGRDLPPPRAPGDGGADGDADGTGGGGGVGGMLFVSEERFDKIRYYLKFGRYPDGADRAEKSRLRSAATHYKLLDDGDTLMLKDKLVVSDPARQYDIARETHSMHHGGINKTTAIIAEKYHWSRIKETVSDVIRLCKECKELAKAPPGAGSNGGGGATGTATTAMQPGQAATRAAASKPTTPLAGAKRSRSPSPDKNTAGSSSLAGTLSSPPRSAPESASHHIQSLAASITTSTTTVDNDRVLGLRMHHTNSTLLSGTLPSSPSTVNPLLHHGGGGGSAVVVGHHHHHHDGVPGPYANPSDISVVRPSQTTLHDGVGGGGGGAVAFLHTPHHHHHHHADDDDDDPNGHAAPHDVYQPIDPQIMNHPHHTFDGYHPHADFQALLHATEDDGGAAESERRAAVDRDLEMLIEHGAGDDEEEDVEEVGEENDGNKQGEDHGDIGAGVLGKMQRPSGGDGAEHGNDGADEGGAAAVVGDEQADADMDDLDDSILQDTRGWT